MDIITPAQRSYTMSRIKGKNTRPERIIFKGLKDLGIKFKRHHKILGNPDIVIPDKKIAVFIDGDFWHGWNFNRRKALLPDYWVTKIKRNILRDIRYRKELRLNGWIVIRVWEHSIIKNPKNCLDKILRPLDIKATYEVKL